MIAPSASAIEAAFREYISNYDGTQKDFSSEVEPLFDALYHENFTIQYKDTTSYESTDEDLYYGKTIDRNAVKDLHISSLSDGVKYTIVHFYSKRIACNCIDVLLCGEKEGEETFTFRVVYRIEGDKLAEAVVVDDDYWEVLKARNSIFWGGKSLFRYPESPANISSHMLEDTSSYCAAA